VFWRLSSLGKIHGLPLCWRGNRNNAMREVKGYPSMMATASETHCDPGHSEDWLAMNYCVSPRPNSELAVLAEFKDRGPRNKNGFPICLFEFDNLGKETEDNRGQAGRLSYFAARLSAVARGAMSKFGAQPRTRTARAITARTTWVRIKGGLLTWFGGGSIT